MPITSKSPFDDPRAKLARARKHFDELRERDKRYFAAHPFGFVSEPTDDGLVIHKVRLNTPLPTDIAVAAGDTVANLRSALDRAVCACARTDGKHDLRNTYFQRANPNGTKALPAKPRRFPRK
jgi:hypothetical protein